MTWLPGSPSLNFDDHEFDDHKFYERGDITFSISHVTTCDLVREVPYKFLDGILQSRSSLCHVWCL